MVFVENYSSNEQFVPNHAILVLQTILTQNRKKLQDNQLKPVNLSYNICSMRRHRVYANDPEILHRTILPLLWTEIKMLNAVPRPDEVV
jgi:hypothetical protein